MYTYLCYPVFWLAFFTHGFSILSKVILHYSGLVAYPVACNQATGYASQHIWCLSQAKINWEGCVRKGIQRKNGGDGRGGAPISLDGVAVHPDCWCICLCYLHFAPENPEDGEMYLLVLAHPSCPGCSYIALQYIKAFYGGLSNKISRSTMSIVLQNNVWVGLLK